MHSHTKLYRLWQESHGTLPSSLDAIPSRSTYRYPPSPLKEEWNKRDILGIIEPVKLDTPYNLVLKDGNHAPSPQIKNHLTETQETHHIPSPFNQVTFLPAQKTGMNAWNEYHSLPLSPASQDATALSVNTAGTSIFVLPRYLMPSGDRYTCQLDDITLDMIRKTRCIDHN